MKGTAVRNCVALLTILLVPSGCQPAASNSSQSSRSRTTHDDASEESGGIPAGGKVELQLLDFDGIQQLIASHRGRVVVMDAWSTSCAPCIKEFPNLVALQQKIGPERLACISLSFDYEGIGQPQDKAPAVQAFLASQQATFDNVLSTDDSDVLYRKFGLASVPAVFVYDQTGQLRKRFDNSTAQREADTFTYEQVGQLVAELLAEQSVGGQEESAPAEE